MRTIQTRFVHFENRIHHQLVLHSITALRIAVGAVFFGFGILKYFPGISPAQNLTEATTHILFLGLVPGGVAIKLIANSHAHVDHILGVSGVKAKTGADFLLHPADLALARLAPQSAARFLGYTPEHPPEPDALLAGGDTIAVEGLHLSVIHTPGHTQGSVCYYTEGMLFSGDTLFRDSIGRTDLPGGDYDQEMASILAKLLVLPDDTVVLPGHMLETKIGIERALNPFIRQELLRRGAGR